MRFMALTAVIIKIMGNIHYITVNTTLFLAGGVCCLGQPVLAFACHLQVWFLLQLFLVYYIKVYYNRLIFLTSWSTL
jgi:hypothetical protein